MFLPAFLVALGGAMGALSRFAIGLAPRLAFPWHTLAVNLVGALLIGAVLARSPGDTPRFFFVIGFLGAFTTMSAYSMETVDLLEAGRRGLAAANVAANALGGPLMAWLGWRFV